MTKMDDKTFLETYDASLFEHPSVTVDIALLTAVDGVLKVLLLERTQPPQQGYWSLAGGFVNIEESLEDAATRVLTEKMGIKDVFLEQLYTFGAPERDPRTRVITVAYYALVNAERLSGLELGTLRVPWEGETGGDIDVLGDSNEVLELAFDHSSILGMAVKRLRGKLNYTPIGFQLLPKRFTLRQLQDVHETILGKKLNKDSFRRKMLASGALEATGQYEQNTSYRPAELYEFVEGSAI